MPDWLASLASLAGPAAYAVVGILAALEASAFVGLVVPGELAMLTGGYIAHLGHARLTVMVAAAVAGAIAGDSLGYEIGRRFGPNLRRSRIGRRVGDERWERAEAYLAAKGGRAVFAGRFVGVLRALVPAVAGAARMPYRRFLGWNGAGAVIWGSGLVLAGYAAGSSYRRMDHYAGRAGLVVFGIAAAFAVVVFAARWIARHPEQVHRAVTRQLERSWVAALNRRYRTQLAFLADRFRLGNALGLALTVQLVILAAAGSVFGTLVEDVISGNGAARIDRPVVRYLAEHRAPWLTTSMHTLTWLGSTTVLIPLAAMVGLLARRRSRSWATLALLGLSFGGAVVLYDLIKLVVGRPRPHVAPLVATATGYSFPSGHSTQVVAVSATLALLASAATDSWSRKVMAWSIAVLVSLIVGFSRVYLGVHWPTDVMAGFALGAAWAALSFTTIRFSRRARVTVGANSRRREGCRLPATRCRPAGRSLASPGGHRGRDRA